ncbi:hypothetical protein NQ315_010999 [Exocentrus adspersus]|uniref:Uncharacterized protein n=1 Tax=Exocentrus adspersus TaxID=1586481 RepID=A0AAV8VIU2_9CUCU|nr:hypothetical protein NQ315_010999 [Exocentrus adspersus]
MNKVVIMGKHDTRSAASTVDKADSEEVEQLITKVCNKFVHRLEDSFDRKLGKLDEKLSEVSNTLKSLNQRVSTNLNEIQNVLSTCDLLEQRNKINCLRFHGLVENDGENVVGMIVSYIDKVLKVPCSESEVDSAYRAGRITNAGKPRAVIVNFVRNIKRNEVLFARKLLKNTEVTIFEDLTRRRYELLLEAKKKYGKRLAWSIAGNVYVMREGKKCLVNSKFGMVIRIYYQNCRGLRTKTNIFYTNLLSEDYDLLLLTETWLTSDVMDSELFDERYEVFRKDRRYEDTDLRTLDLVFGTLQLIIDEDSLPLVEIDKKHPALIAEFNVAKSKYWVNNANNLENKYDFKRANFALFYELLRDCDWNELNYFSNVDDANSVSAN